MSDLVERLRAEATENRRYEVTGTLAIEAADRIEQLEAENASLASWQCEFTDGKTGLVASEGGSTYCAMAKRVQKLEAALRGAEAWLQNWAVHAGRCEGGNGCTCGLTAIRFDTRAALEERT